MAGLLPKGLVYGPLGAQRLAMSEQWPPPSRNTAPVGLGHMRSASTSAASGYGPIWEKVAVDLQQENFIVPRFGQSTAELVAKVLARCETNFQTGKWTTVVAAMIDKHAAELIRDRGVRYHVELIHVLNSLEHDTGKRIITMCVDPLLPHESLAQAFAKVLEVSIAGEITNCHPEFDSMRVSNKGGTQIQVENKRRTTVIKDKIPDFSLHITLCRRSAYPTIYGEAGYSQCFSSVLNNLADMLEGSDVKVGLGATICSVLTEQGWTKPLLTVVVVSRCTDGVIVVSDPMNFGHDQEEEKPVLRIRAALLVQGDSELTEAAGARWITVPTGRIETLILNGLRSDEKGLSTEAQGHEGYLNKCQQATQEVRRQRGFRSQRSCRSPLVATLNPA